MDVLAELLNWHLAEDNRPPLTIVNNKLVPVKNPASMLTPKSASTTAPDKCIVFCELPSSFPQIRHVSNLLLLFLLYPLTASPHHQVLALHNIKTLELHGKVPASQ